VFTDLLSKRCLAWLLEGLVWLVMAVVGIVIFGNGNHTLGVVLVVGAGLLSTLEHVVNEGLTGQTLAKRLVGLHTRRAEQPYGKPGVGRAAIRYVLYPVDAFPVIPVVGLVSMLRSPRQQRIGDRVAGTIVGRPIPARGVAGEPASSLGVLMDLPAPDGRPSREARAEQGWDAGWYADPEDPVGTLRWFDGSERTNATRSRILSAEDVASL
jgi:uncharacterized RDD family membrane protein YckC